MEKVITREDIVELLSQVEHPEIAISLADLGMILDVGLTESNARVAIALPKMNIPDNIRDAIVNSISVPLSEIGLTMDPVFFEMSPEDRERFFNTARANWKGAI